MSESTLPKTVVGAVYEIADVYVDNQTLVSGTSNLYTIPVGKTGYTPLGITNVNIDNASSSGTGRIFCSCAFWYIEGTNAKIGVQKIAGTSNAKIKVIATVLYKKN